MQALAPSAIFQFEDFRLDRRGGGLFRCNGAGTFEPVGIGSRALDILGALIDRAGEVVSKEEIVAAVWPATVVEDSNLTVQISALRRVLDRGGSNGSCIQTVPGRGYRFVATVTRSPTDPLPEVGGNVGDSGDSTLLALSLTAGARIRQRPWREIAVLCVLLPWPDRWRRGFGIIVGWAAPTRGLGFLWWCSPFQTSGRIRVRSNSSML